MTHRSVRHGPPHADYHHIESPPNPSAEMFSDEAIRAFVEKHLNEEAEPSEQMRRMRDRHSRTEPSIIEEPEAIEPPAPKRRRFRPPKYQPKWSHTMLVLALTVTLAQPLLLPSLLVAACAGLIISYLTLGHERFCELSLRGLDRLEKYRPALAARIRARLTGLGNALPERLADAFYVSGGTADTDLPEKMRQDPFEKLAREARDL